MSILSSALLFLAAQSTLSDPKVFANGPSWTVFSTSYEDKPFCFLDITDERGYAVEFAARRNDPEIILSFRYAPLDFDFRKQESLEVHFRNGAYDAIRQDTYESKRHVEGWEFFALVPTDYLSLLPAAESFEVEYRGLLINVVSVKQAGRAVDSLRRCVSR